MTRTESKLWETSKARFVQSYENTCPTVRKIAAVEMTDHRFLTPDRHVQQTRFANGMAITVNFGTAPYPLPGGGVLGAMQYRVSGTE